MKECKCLTFVIIYINNKYNIIQIYLFYIELDNVSSSAQHPPRREYKTPQQSWKSCFYLWLSLVC